MSKKALLMILDGWGLGDQKKDDVIFNTPTPYWDYLMNNYPHSQLQASGENVGLPDGQMGNSEVPANQLDDLPDLKLEPIDGIAE